MAEVEELRVQAGSALLSGTLRLPDVAPATAAAAPRRVPAVLLLPSWLPRDRDGGWDRTAHPGWFSPFADAAPLGLLARLAEALAAAGVASLRCDPRGCGASDGRWEAVDLFTRIDDARDMIAALRADGRLDLRRMGIIGHGEGATVALAVAAGDPAISALTLIGPSARSFDSVLRAGVALRARTGIDRAHPVVAAVDRWSEDLLERAARGEPAFDLPLSRAESVPISLAWVEQSVRTPPRALATILDRSCALVHGALDAWATPDESALLAEALGVGGSVAARTVIAGAGHDLAEAAEDKIGALVADLVERLRPVELPPVLVAIEEMGLE